MKKFELGQTVMTRGFIALFENPFGAGIIADSLVKRHQSGDWGDLSKHDSAANDAAILPGQEDRILSSYTIEVGGKQHTVWVITEWDRSVSTILLPSEY